MSNYDESSIRVLEGTEGIRQRPAMYIGDVGHRGFHHLVNEVVDNSIDEAMAGRCSKVDLEIFEDNSIKITDDGVGIPAGKHPVYGVSTLQVILTKLHSGGKFDKKAYSVSGGLHGIGLAAVCALSEKFHVESHRDGKIYSQDYKRGQMVNEEVTSVDGKQETGTVVHFKPDSSIFTEKLFDFEYLEGRLKELAYLTEGFTITLKDHRYVETITINDEKITRPKEVTYYFEGGISKFVEDLVGKRDLILPNAPIFYTKGESDGVIVEVAFAYVNDQHNATERYVNNINTTEGGTHESGFRTVLTRTINKFASDFGLLDKKRKSKSKSKSKSNDKDDKVDNLTGPELNEGRIAVISAKVPEPQFEGQTKTKLGNSEVAGIVQEVVGEPLEKFLNDNPDLGKAIVTKALEARRIREATKNLEKKLRSGSGRVSLPGKLYKSNGNDPMNRELFLVEGQSAGGTAVKGRNNDFQEILFLRGKVLNVEKARYDRALENAEIANLIAAIGAGIMDDFDIEKCRYGKVILLTDADVDGAHIAILLLTFFYRYMKPLIEHGRLFIARPPLFKVQFRGDAKKLAPAGKDYIYLSDDGITTAEDKLDALIDGFQDMQIDKNNYSISRYKGLGEMNHDQLRETVMDRKLRRIDLINISDAISTEEWLTRLMGDDVDFRRKYIQEDVFEETELNSRGPFYDLAFGVESKDDDEDDALDIADSDIGEDDPDGFSVENLLNDFDKYFSDQDGEDDN